MICVDTTFLIDLWRNRSSADHPALALLRESSGETLAVPAPAAGEFLEGAAGVSEERLRESLVFLSLFATGSVGLETAKLYAGIVSDLRRRSCLLGASKHDLWIAAWAIEHGATLATQNRKHFEKVRGLRLLSY